MFSILSIIISTLICNSSYLFNNDVTVSISNSTHEYNISSIFDEYCNKEVEEYNPLYDNVTPEDYMSETNNDIEIEIVVNNNYSVENITYDNVEEEVEVEEEIDILVVEEVEIEVEQIINTTE